MSFTHLHVHSGFSFLYGTFTPEALVEKAYTLDIDSCALTDKNGLYGAIRFYRAAKKKGIHPILGTEVTLEDGSSLILLASSLKGYGNLCKLITHMHTSNERDNPKCSLEMLERHRSDLIALTGGREGRPWSLTAQGRKDEALSFVSHLKDIFGKDNLFIEIHNHHLPGDREIMEVLADLGHTLNLSLVATNGVCFLEPENYRVHQALVGIQRAVHHRDVAPVPNHEFYLRSSKEMKSLIPYQDALEHTSLIAERCRFDLPLGRLNPPSSPSPDGKNPHQVLIKLCYKQLSKKYWPIPAKVLRQLEHELRLIEERELSDYFLIVYDILGYARKKGIRCTVRGSAAGSLVNYLLIGGVDPIVHDLLFQRFLNEDRYDMPDIDLDFDSDRRDEVTEYVLDKYGSDRAALVATIPTFKARSAVREIGRALGYSYGKIDTLTNFLPYYLKGSQLEEAFQRLPELKGSDLEREREILDIASRLDGLPRNLSIHSGGIVISGDQPLTSLVPVEISAKGFPVAQFDKDDIEALGLVKLDLLGLRMHTAINKSLGYLKEKGVDLNLEELPLNDSKTYHLLRSTDTVGVFQLESPGQRQLLGRLQPRCFSDIIAEISLFRPGPMQADMITPYVRRKNSQEKITYLHPTLRPILKETYGVIIFQEQILKIAHKLAGFSYGEADTLRRAMTKDKSHQEMAKLKKWFIKGCLNKGTTKEVAEEVFSRISAFASFGFCKAHAASFAYITYQSAYLKAHHPLEFYVGLLNAGQVGSYPKSVILNDARRRGFQVLSPHVNFSQEGFSIEGKAIRIGLSSIKGIGPRFIERILSARESGLFLSMEDFTSRVSLPSSAIKTLRWAHAFKGLTDITERKVAYA